jgi:MscS family membrane protein
MDTQQLMSIIWDTHYLKALAIFLVAYIVMQILLFVFEKVFLKLALKTKTKVDDYIVERTRLPLAFLIMVIGARFATEALEFSELINLNIGRVFSSIILIIIAHVIIVILDILVDNWGRNLVSKSKSKIDDDLLILFHRIIKTIFYLLALLYVLSIWGIQIAPLLASLGVAGIAVAFALQSTLGNIFGGVALIMDKTIRSGDIVKLEDGSLGTVIKISLRSTKIRTFDNEVMTIPNGKFANSKITNWYMPNRKVRINIKFGVVYGSDPDKAKKVVMDVIKKEKKAIKDPEPYILFTEMADFSLNFVARFWIKDISDKLSAKDRVTTGIYKALNKNKIGIPFPTRTIYMKKDE